MVTDWYPQQEGRIADGLTINCIVGATAVKELDIVTYGTSAADQITVIPAVSTGDGWGVALKAGAVGDPVPVLVYGLVKLKCGERGAGFTQGEVCLNCSELWIDSAEDLAPVEASVFMFGGTSTILGTIMQTSTADLDEVLVLVGRQT